MIIHPKGGTPGLTLSGMVLLRVCRSLPKLLSRSGASKSLMKESSLWKGHIVRLHRPASSFVRDKKLLLILGQAAESP